GTGAKNQRKLTIAIKRARIMGLLPFVSDEQ
ncbi:30S ribosomal protein S18, partial [Enterococcus faecalis]